MSESNTTELQLCLDKIRQGDDSARALLLQRSEQRLLALTRRMLDRFPRVRRWEQTDDVLQNVLLRLDRLLRSQPVDAVLDYLRLASTHIRRELIDLARHHYGPQGNGTHHATPLDAHDPQALLNSVAAPGCAAEEVTSLAEWGQFHASIDQLPEEHRLLFDLIWYQGLTQQEAATVLMMSLSTLKRRWQAARLALMERYHGELPS